MNISLNSSIKETIEEEINKMEMKDFTFYLSKGNKVVVYFDRYVLGMGWAYPETFVELKGNY